MKKYLYVSLTLAILVACAASTARPLPSNPTIGSSNNMKSSPMRIRLGDPKDSDLKGPGSSTDNHPSGMKFYQREWERGSLGTVEFMHGKHSFKIDNVLSVLGTDDQDVSEGIYDWSINFGVSSEQADTPEAALARMMKLFSDLRKNGWIRYIKTNHPRLTGQQTFDYIKINSIYSLDPNYTPTIAEWKAAARKMPHWIFYADGVYLDVSPIESNMGNFVGKSTYLLTMHLKSEYSFYGIGYFSGNSDKINKWKMLLPAELQKYHAMRLKTEAVLKEQGYTIDTTYQDPPIKALQGSSANPQ
ncbi:hypothetical protein [Trinickia sp.]|uniref:hypothetical protein n=1 Tax=Trinickia sp. TaxID=2571163 RepID=UPI003F7D33CF